MKARGGDGGAGVVRRWKAVGLNRGEKLGKILGFGR